jgi:hypothetical protein
VNVSVYVSADLEEDITLTFFVARFTFTHIHISFFGSELIDRRNFFLKSNFLHTKNSQMCVAYKRNFHKVTLKPPLTQIIGSISVLINIENHPTQTLINQNSALKLMYLLKCGGKIEPDPGI